MKIGYELRPQEQFTVHYKIKRITVNNELRCHDIILQNDVITPLATLFAQTPVLYDYQFMFFVMYTFGTMIYDNNVSYQIKVSKMRCATAATWGWKKTGFVGGGLCTNSSTHQHTNAYTHTHTHIDHTQAPTEAKTICLLTITAVQHFL